MKQTRQIKIKFQLLEDTEGRWTRIFDVLERLAAEARQKVETNNNNQNGQQ